MLGSTGFHASRRERVTAGNHARSLIATSALLAALAGGTLATSALALAGHAAGKAVSVKCKGNSSSCKAVVGVAGGASNKKLQISLTDTNLKLAGVTAKPSSIKGAYSLSGGKYSLGGSLYTVTLNAVQAIPKGATLTFNFAVPATRKNCTSVTKGISHLSVAKLGSKQSKGAYGCQQANAVSNTWMLRFEAKLALESFEVSNVTYRCKLVATLPQNIQCDGGGTRVKFSGPTGH